MLKKFNILIFFLTPIIVFFLSFDLTRAVTSTNEGECTTDSCALPNPLVGNKTSVSEIIGTIIKTALSIIGAITLLMFVWGGFRWFTSAGNPEKVKAGTQTMVWAVIGLFLVFASYLLLSTFLDFLTGTR